MLSALLTHLELVFISVGIGFIIAVPLGIMLSRHKNIAKYVLALISIIQTIPGLVLLGIALLLFGLGKVPAVFVLVLYAILPILQNTYTGICEVEDNLREAARGNGMTDLQILLKVEFPLALASIIAGLRISTVYIISWATLAALIGAGGLGDLIWTGLASYDNKFILAGAVPASIIAILSGILINLLQNAVTPKGIKAIQ
jgi:osmoprotectant transport system permease protein